MKRLLTLSAMMLIPSLALAADYQIGDITIDHPTSFETPATAKAGAGYLIVTNTGDSADSLIDVRADFPRVMLHETTETDGIARMSHVESLEIPAGETVKLAPGGYHVMFMGLDAPFTPGDTFPATLVFEHAGEVDVTFTVKPRKHHGHSHNHANHGSASGHGDHSDHEKSE